MSLNCNELNLILSELDLNGAFIQEIVQPGFDTLVFRTVNKGDIRNLVICTGAQACRINTTNSRIPKNKKPLRFNEFLKSRVQGMRINSCTQLGLERIIKFDVSTWQERLYIYVRLWSGASNVIVCTEDNTILDCMYRRPNKGEVTGGTFILPESKVLSQEELEENRKKFPIRTFEDIPQEKQESSFNEKIDWYYTERAGLLSRETLLLQAEKWFNVKHSRMVAALEKLLSKQKDFENSEILKHTGDLILANSYLIQSGDTVLTCTDYDTGKEVHIKIDSKKSPQENAQHFYEQYKKAASGMDALIHDIELSKRAIAILEKEYDAIQKEQNVLKIEQMLRKDTAPKQKEEKAHAGLHYELDGWTLIVGRNANENDDLLRHTVRGQDLWLHTRDYAGGYVFVKARSGKTVPLDILLYAGNLAVYHSKARQNGQADLYYTQVKHLRRAKNGPKGLVLPTQEKNLHIKLDSEKLKKLDEIEKGLL